MNTRTTTSDTRKEQILFAAMNVFAEKGLNNSRMDDIAAASGVSKGTLYNYYTNKEELIMAISKFLLGQSVDSIKTLGETSASIKEFFASFSDSLLLFSENVLPFLPIIYEFYGLGLREEAFREVLSQYLNTTKPVFQKVLQKGVNNKEIKVIDTHQMAFLLMSIVEGALLLQAYSPEDIDAIKTIRYGFETVLGPTYIKK